MIPTFKFECPKVLESFVNKKPDHKTIKHAFGVLRDVRRDDPFFNRTFLLKVIGRRILTYVTSLFDSLGLHTHSRL